MATRSSILDSQLALIANDQSYYAYGQNLIGSTLGTLDDRPSVSPTNPYSNSQIYNTNAPYTVPAGFVVVGQVSRPDIGGKALIYQNTATNTFMVSFK